MATWNQTILGSKQPRYRAMGAIIAVLVGYALAFLARIDTILPVIGVDLIAFGVGLGIAAYAGRARGGALAGIGSVFLLLLWISFIPPLVAYLRGLKLAESRYTTIRMSQVQYTPEQELEAAVGQVPFLLIFAFFIGGIFFLIGASTK